MKTITKIIALTIASATVFSACDKPDSQNQIKDYLIGKWSTIGQPNRFAGVDYELTLTVDNKYTLKETYFNDMVDTTTIGCNKNRVEYHQGTYALQKENTMVLEGKYTAGDFMTYMPNCAQRTDFDTTLMIKGDYDFLYINNVDGAGSGMALKKIP